METIGEKRTDTKDNVKDRGKSYLKKKILQPEAHLKFSFNFDFAPVGCYISDFKGAFFDINKAAERITGYTRDELSGKNYHKAGLLSLKDVARVMESLAKNRRGLLAEQEEYVLTGKDKKPIDVEISTFPIKINEDRLALGIIRDISKYKKAERALKESEKEKSVILDSSPMRILCRDKDYNIIWANKAACDYIKKDLEETLEIKCYKYWKGRVTLCGDCPSDKIWLNRTTLKREKRTRDGKYWYIIDTPFKNEKNEVVAIIQNALDITEQKEAQKKLKNIVYAIIEAISKIMDTRDPYTAGHQKRVTQLAFAISREMKLSLERIESVRIASQIHDIGKIGIPSEILTKPSVLDSVEFSFMKKHPGIGYNILKGIAFPYPIAQIVLQHHERIDGSGYPDGLKGEEILFEAKIIAVADVVEAMSSHRPYREALGIDVALEEIEKNKGTLYEPEIVDVCIKLFREKGFKFR